MDYIVGKNLWMPLFYARIYFHPFHEIHLREFRLT